MAYSPEEIEDFKTIIIEQLSLGNSLKSILDDLQHLPSRPTVYTWLNESHNDYDIVFFNNYTRAREDSADLDAEKVQEIAEKTLDSTYEPAAARVAIDAYKWNAGKKKPKKYGDRINTDITTDGESLNKRPDLSGLSDVELQVLTKLYAEQDTSK